MSATTNCPTIERLRLLLDGKLPDAEQVDLQQHIDECETCQRTLEGLVAGKESWEGIARQLGEAMPVTPALQDVMVDAIGVGPTAFDGTAHSVKLPPGLLQPAQQPDSMGRLAHYEILQEVGSGGMGIVLKAFDTSLRRVVAIKLMAPHLAANAAARRRFVREAQAAAAVAHEHVVAIHAVADQHEPPYLAMQFIEGKTLQERLDKSGPLSVREVLRIGMQTAAGLAAAHAQGLVHRDIKPANILLENGVERVKLTDFGLARAVDDASVTQSGVIAGTPQYMSPEQARGEVVDHRSDLFSLGCVLYAMCVGHAPFRASTTMGVLKRVCEDAPRPIREMNPDVPDWLVAIIDKLIAKRPEDRFQTAKEVAELLSQCLAHQQQPSVVPLPVGVAIRTPLSAASPFPSPSFLQKLFTYPLLGVFGILLLGASLGMMKWKELMIASCVVGLCVLWFRWVIQAGNRPLPTAASDTSPAPRVSFLWAPLTFPRTLGVWLAVFLFMPVAALWIGGRIPQDTMETLTFASVWIWLGVIAVAILINRLRASAHAAGVPLADLAPGWRIRCTKCGKSKPLGEVGGIRIGARSIGKRTLAWCSQCHALRWAAIERDEASSTASAPPVPCHPMFVALFRSFLAVQAVVLVLIGLGPLGVSPSLALPLSPPLMFLSAAGSVAAVLMIVVQAIQTGGLRATALRPSPGVFGLALIALVVIQAWLFATQGAESVTRSVWPTDELSRVVATGATLVLAGGLLIAGVVIGIARFIRGLDTTTPGGRLWGTALSGILLSIVSAGLLLVTTALAFYQFSHTERPMATVHLTLQVPGPHVQVTLNGEKVFARPDTGHVDLELPRGEYALSLLGKGQLLGRTTEHYGVSQVKVVMDPKVDAIEITGPFVMSYGPGAKPPSVADYTALQGRWVIVSQDKNGVAVTESLRGQWIEFDRGHMRFDVPINVARSQAVLAESLVALYAHETPSQIDVLSVGAKGIYKLDGDMLTLAIADAGQPRPADFVSRPASTVTLTVCRRAQESTPRSNDTASTQETIVVPAVEGIAWGHASPKGVQLGIELEPRRAAYRIGETAKLRLHLRNSGTESISATQPRVEVLEKFGFDLMPTDESGKELTWSWGRAHKSRNLWTVSGATAFTLRPGATHELPSAEIVIGQDEPSTAVMAHLDVQPGQMCRFVCKLSTYGYAKGEGEPLESGALSFQVATADGAIESSAVIQQLRELVSLSEQDVETTRAQYKAGVSPFAEVVKAEMSLTETKIRLAQAEGKTDEAARLHDEFVKQHEGLVKVIEDQFKAGTVPASELAQVRKALTESRIQQEKARQNSSTEPSAIVTKPKVTEPPAKLLFDKAGVWNLTLSHDRKLLGAVGPNGEAGSKVKVWDATTLTERLTVTDERTIYDLVFLSDGERFVTCESDLRMSWIRIRELATGQVLHEFEPRPDATLALAVSRDGETLISGGADKVLSVWDLSTKQLRKSLSGAMTPIHSVAISDDGKLAAVGCENGEVHVWDIETSESRHRWTHFIKNPTSVAFSPDGKHLAVASWNHLACVFDIGNDYPWKFLQGHIDQVRAIAWSADGQRVATASSDGSAMLWDAAKHNQRLATFVGHADQCYDAVFLDEGRLATAHRDGNVRVWNIKAVEPSTTKGD